MRGSGSHQSSSKFGRLFLGCCSSVYGNVRLPWTVFSALRRLSGALLCQERHYSCSALIQTVPAAQAGVGKVPGRGAGLFLFFFFLLSSNLSESASAKRSRNNISTPSHGISCAGGCSGTNLRHNVNFLVLEMLMAEPKSGFVSPGFSCDTSACLCASVYQPTAPLGGVW